MLLIDPAILPPEQFLTPEWFCGRLAHRNSSPKSIPSMFNRIQVKGIGWQSHSLNIPAFQLVINHEILMCSRTAVYKNEFRANSATEKMHIAL